MIFHIWFPKIGLPFNDSSILIGVSIINHPFFPRASERRVLLIVEVCHHIFSSSRLLIFTSSHLQTFSSSHLFIFISSSHFLVFTPSHLHILPSCALVLLPSCSLALLPSRLSFLSISLLRSGQCQRGATKRNPFARNEVRSSKAEVKLRFNILSGNAFARNEVRSPKSEVKLRF